MGIEPPVTMNSVTPQKSQRAAKRTASASQLLEATSKILAQRNAIDVSFSEIAESSGLNSALIKYRRDATSSLSRLNDLIQMKIPPEQKIRLHVAGVINTYIRYPYLNRLIHLLLNNSSEQITQELANFFVRPLVEAQSKILEEGFAQGVFRRVDPMFFYYSMIGACDHIFFARYSLKFAFGVDEITPTLRDNYVEYVADMVMGMLRKD
jgi:hypothetical protein